MSAQKHTIHEILLEYPRVKVPTYTSSHWTHASHLTIQPINGLGSSSYHCIQPRQPAKPSICGLRNCVRPSAALNWLLHEQGNHRTWFDQRRIDIPADSWKDGTAYNSRRLSCVLFSNSCSPHDRSKKRRKLYKAWNKGHRTRLKLFAELTPWSTRHVCGAPVQQSGR